jgi:hypothetical protein
MEMLQVTLVVNYDIPVKNVPPFEPDYELYLHRIGRSGRFGRKGTDLQSKCLVKTSRCLLRSFLSVIILIGEEFNI